MPAFQLPDPERVSWHRNRRCLWEAGSAIVLAVLLAALGGIYCRQKWLDDALAAELDEVRFVTEHTRNYQPYVRPLWKHIRNGARVDIRNAEGETALMWAAYSDDTELVRHLLARGATVDFRDEDGRTALTWAAGRGQAANLGLLLNAGAAIDGEQNSPLFDAVLGGHLDAVRLLLSRGARVNVSDSQGATPLMLAAEGGHPAMVELFLAAGADVNRRDREGRTALSAAAQAQQDSGPAVEDPSDFTVKRKLNRVIRLLKGRGGR